MLSFRKRVLTAVVLSLAVALPAIAADAPAPAFEKYMPDAADGVITINVRQLLDSELIKKAGLDKALAGDDAQKSVKALGIDPLKDIERVIITGDKEKPDDVFVIVQGKFDPAKLAAAADDAVKEKKGEHLKIHKSEHGKIYEVSNLDEVITLPPQAAGAVGGALKNRSIFATIPDKGHVVFTGSKEAAEGVLVKGAGKKATKLSSKELPGLLAKMNLKQSVAVALPSPDDKVKNITGGITVTSDVKTRFTVAASNADAAKQIDDLIGEQLKMVQDIAGLVVLQQKELAPVLDILNSFKHEAKDSDVGINSDIKGETLEKVVKALAEFAAKQGIK